MASDNETVEAELRDIRKRALVALRMGSSAKGENAMVHHYDVGVMVNDIADRIESAWRRERAELYEAAKQSHNCDDCKEVHTRTRERDIAESKYKELVKERDELKAKLDCADVDRETYKDRAEAAERCIEEISKAISRTHTEMRVDYAKIEDIIRAYREKREVKR